MQSDLVQQEREYEILCSLDAKEDCPTTRSYQSNWTALNDSQGLGYCYQRDAWRKLRDGLGAYSMCTPAQFGFRQGHWHIRKNNALLQQIEICKQDGPSEHDLRILRNWLQRPKGNQSSLRGPGCDVWEASEGRLRDSENDFLVLSPKHRKRDRFERWAGDTFLRVYHRLIGRRFKVSRGFQGCHDVLKFVENFHQGWGIWPQGVQWRKNLGSSRRSLHSLGPIADHNSDVCAIFGIRYQGSFGDNYGIHNIVLYKVSV